MLRLRHLKGFNGELRGGLRANPRGGLVYVSGRQVVLSSEDPAAPRGYLCGHDDSVTALAVAHSGTMCASGCKGQNSDVIVWDLATQQPRFRFQEHDLEVVQLAFSHDDRLLLSCGHERDQKLFVIDTSTGNIVCRGALEMGKRVTASAWSPVFGQSYVFATAADIDITIWSVEPYRGMISMQKVTLGSVRRTFTSMAFSPDGMWLYAGTSSGDVVTVNVQRTAVQMVHPACSGGVGAVVLSTSGRPMVAGGDGSITMFTTDHMWREIKPFVQVPGSVSSLSSTPDGSALLVGTLQGQIFRVASGSLQVATLETSHTRGVRDLAYAAGSPEWLASSSDDGTVCLWSTQDHSQHLRIAEPALNGSRGGGCALSVALSPDSLVVGWEDGSIRAYARGQGYTPPCAWLIPGAHQMAHSSGVTRMKLATRGAFLASGGAGGELRVWDMRSREMMAHLKAHSAPISGLEVLADDAHIMAASHDRSLSIWDIREEKCRNTWRTNTLLHDLAMLPDQVSALTVSMDRRILQWDIRAPEPVRQVPNAHNGEVTCVAVDPRGGLFVTGGTDCVIKTWDLRTLQQVSQVAGHTGAITRLVYTPSAPGVASSAADGSIGLWDLQ